MSFEGLPVESADEAIQELKNIGFDSGEAEEVAELLREEAKEDEENAKTLWNNLKNKADAFIAELGLETFSWVGNPSQPSKFVMMKSGDGQFNSSSPILKDVKEEEDDWEVVYAPVMQPSAVDKDGEVIPSKVIRDSAHEFLSEGKTDQIDADHNLITGKGELVESWILKEDKEYDLPDHYEEDSFTVEKGSWMVGVKPTEEARKKIESGEYTGFSIFGEAEKIELSTSFKMKEVDKDVKGDNMGENENEGEDIGLKEVAEGVETLKEGLSDLEESVSEIKEEKEVEAKEVSTVEELKEALGSDEPVSLELEADDLDFEKEEDSEEKEEEETEKGVDETIERLAEQLDMSKEEVRSALELEDDEDEEDEEEDEKEAKGKGTTGEGVRKSEVETEEKSGNLSFQSKAEEQVEG